MKREEFQKLTSELEKVTPYQKEQLLDHLQKMDNAQAVSMLIEKCMKAKPARPKCGNSKIARWGLSAGLQRYRCSACRITFNALTRTPLARGTRTSGWLIRNRWRKAGVYEAAQSLAQCIAIRHFAGATAFLHCRKIKRVQAWLASLKLTKLSFWNRLKERNAA